MQLRLLIMLLMMSAFAGLRADEAWPAPRDLGKEIPVYRPPEKPVLTSEDLVQEPTGSLTLSQALSLALMKNPELRAFSLEVRAAEARALQAGLFPNPEFGYEIENFGGSREFRSLDAAEKTISLGQLIELGGKRSKRRRLASLERDLTGWDHEARRRQVFTEVAQSFAHVLAAQQRVALGEELVRLAEEVNRTVSERVKAGKVSPIEETKSSVALASNRIELERTRRELKAARARMASTWGSSRPAFEKTEGSMEPASGIPSLDQITDLVSNNPDIARWVVEMEQRRAAVKLEESRRIPDPVISAGTRHFNDTDQTGYVIGVSIPLPIFDRNQGAILESRHRLLQAEEQRKAAEVAVRTGLSEVYQTLAASFVETNALKNEVLPGAQSAFDAAVEGYRQGKFGYLEVLDAQRTLFEARGQYIRSLEAYFVAAAEVERLIGVSLERVKQGADNAQ